MAAKSKFFRVAVEGATSDGRTIERSWLEQIAASYSPATYGARVNLEHYKGILPDSPFRAYGDVLAVKTEEVDIGGAKKLALFAQIDPTPELVALSKKRQKIYTSIEVAPKFADTGKAYLVGLAVTDNPASLGTEALAFAAQHPNASPFTQRKAHPENLISEALEFTLELEGADDDSGALAKFKANITAAIERFTGKAKTDDERFGLVAEGFKKIGDAFTEHADHTAAGIKANTSAIESLQAEVKTLREKFAVLDKTPANPGRPTATGGAGQVQTEF
ncbi:capsid scaffolding serine peptidase GPO [Pseudacidovorax intermedius]|uniref:Capsid scaffolding serine peptidase GPO n=1 Tax=Pseudacidovorax intermedius TaxID=433924 RepID=A0A370F896_9BURK|nr:GPO family capsid scaffolding protein [Pseudacidovorax intermedius]RDI20746.1 capsid scaffolding serine peptidase GPO [Pseudacidovorax intermedius]